MEHSDTQRIGLGAHIKTVRTRRGMTLDALAEASRTSRATLSRIENGEVSPTAETLSSLAAALSTSISHLIEPIEQPFRAVLGREDQPVWHDTSRGFERRSVSPPCPHLAGEVIECHLTPHQHITYQQSPVAGLEHHLIMLGGSLHITVDGAEHALKAGDCLRYKLTGGTRFTTRQDAAHYILVLIS